MQWYDYLRLITALLAAFAAYRLGRTVLADYKTYSNRLSEYIWIIFAVLFTQFTGAIENMIKGTDYRYGSLLSFLIALAAVRATRKSNKPLQNFNEPRSNS